MGSPALWQPYGDIACPLFSSWRGVGQRERMCNVHIFSDPMIILLPMLGYLMSQAGFRPPTTQAAMRIISFCNNARQ